MSSDTTIAGDVLNQQTHLAYKRMVKKKGVGIPCHFSKVCIFDLFSYKTIIRGNRSIAITFGVWLLKYHTVAS